MPIINSISNMKEEMQEWRRYLHTIPELGFEEFKTADFISKKLSEFGVEVHQNVAKTGIIGVLHGSEFSEKAIGLRADMDALPIQETSDISYKSKNDGIMHACGHDGHTAMLLGTAEVLSKQAEKLNRKLQFLPNRVDFL